MIFFSGSKSRSVLFVCFQQTDVEESLHISADNNNSNYLFRSVNIHINYIQKLIELKIIIKLQFIFKINTNYILIKISNS